jgi:hypothetical protein
LSRLRADQIHSEYYPPRARWFSRVLIPWLALHRVLHLERIHLPSGISFLQFILSLLLPGYAFFAKGRRLLGWCFVGAYFAFAIIFVVALGYLISGMAFGFMIAAHASSIVFLEGHWLREGARFSLRLVLSIITLLVVWQIFYSPFLRFAQAHWIMPLQVKERVVVIQRITPVDAIRPGEFIVYSISSDQIGDGHQPGGAVRVQDGLASGPVLAVGGDRIRFSSESFFVNGRAHALLPHMPVSGELTVPEKHWFIWPELGIYQQGNTREETIASMMFQLAMVSEEQFAGKPFRHWFGRRQIYHEPIR